MPRKQKKYHFIYKTTNLLNNKFYIGMHSTDNLEDGYFGSGKVHSDKMSSDPTYKSKVSNSLSEAWKIRSTNGEKPFGGKGNTAFLGKSHSEETLQKMRKSKNVGESNSQFGSRWIHNLELKISKKIKKADPLPIGWKEGRKLKFTNS